MIRRPPRSTLSSSSAASDVYKRQRSPLPCSPAPASPSTASGISPTSISVSYTHLRAHETVLDIVCRLLLEKKNRQLKERHRHTIWQRHITSPSKRGVIR